MATWTAKNVIDEQGRMEAERKNHDSLRSLCVSLSYPGRSAVMDWYSVFDDQKGRPNTVRPVYDATAIKGLEIWSSGIIGQYMPRETNWFAEEMAERSLRDSPAVRRWLQETDEHMRYAINRSNYHEQKRIAILDAGAIGDSIMFIEEDEGGRQMMIAPHPREFWFRRDFWGRIVAIHHKFNKSLRQIKDELGEAALSDSQKEALERSPNTQATMIHAIYKNPDYIEDRAGVKNMRWRHIYVNVHKDGPDGSGDIVTETGSQTMNPVVWSLNRQSHESYGRGQVAQMLVEVLTANYVAKDIQIAGQMATRPPTLITSALKHKLRMGAGAMNFVNSDEMRGIKMGDLVARIIDSSGYPFGVDNHARWQQMVEDRFGVSLFLALNYAEGTPKTLGEVRLRQAEKATLMSPFLATLGTATDLEFDRMYDIEYRAGRAPEPPLEVFEAQNRRVDIQYIGPLAQILKQYYEVGNLLTTIENMRMVAEVYPESLVVADGDELMRKIMRAANAPEDLILSVEDVQEIEAIAAEQAEAQMQAELASKASGVVPNISKKIENDSVLSKILEAA